MNNDMDQKKIKQFLKKYIGYNFDFKNIEKLVKDIKNNKIIASIDKKYITELSMKYIKYSKKGYFYVDIKRS